MNGNGSQIQKADPNQAALALIGGFAPTNLTQTIAMAEMLGRSGLVPAAIRGKPSDILVVMLTGHDFGLSPMASLRLISVIDGKPIIGGEAYLACVRAYEKCKHFRCVETTAEKATFSTQRTDDDVPQTLTWTIKQAAVAQLLIKDNWKKYPEAMLRWRCISALAKLVFPERFAGVYVEDEADDVRANANAIEGVLVTPTDAADKLAERARTAKEAAPQAAAGASVEVVEEKKPDLQVVPDLKVVPKPDAKQKADDKVMAEVKRVQEQCEALKVTYDGQKLLEDSAYREALAAKLVQEAKRAAGAVSENTMDRADKAGPPPHKEVKTPSQLWTDAGGDNAKFQQLMLEHGHLVKAADAKKPEEKPAELGPIMVFGPEGVKGKPIASLDGVTLLQMIQLGEAKIGTLAADKVDKVRACIEQIKAEHSAREKRLDDPAEPGLDVD